MVRFLLLFILGNTFLLQGQDITQSVTGKVKDISTFTELAGASISIFSGSELITGASTDSEGQFRFSLPPGRYRLVVSFTGYVSIENELLVIAGKMPALEILLQESPTLLAEVVVSPESISEPGVTSLSIEKTLRAPANFFDPVRMLTSYPGVVTANDQANSIIVKGYSPNGILWRLQGLDIINPNHTANAGTLSDKPTANGGGVSVLSAQILDRTDFYSGNLPTRYGNALAGVMNMSLRPGSSEKIEYTAQASLIGIDLAAEGPFSKKSESSFLVNYRYSTVGLLSQVGVDFGDEAIGFQDLSFHLNFPGKSSANLSVFGFGGLSKNEFDAKPESEWEEEKDRYTIDYDGKVYGVGFVNQFKPGWLSLSLGASLSGQEQNRTSQGTTVPYPAIYSESYFSNRLLVSTFLKGVRKIKNGLLEAGVVADYLDNEMDVSTVTPLYIDSFYPNASGTVNGMLWQPYANWTHYVGKLTLNAGMRYVNFGYNNSDALEPRVSVSGNLDKNSITLSYAATSQWQQVQTYITQGNKQLPFTKSNQFALEWRRKFNTDISVVSSIYYHELNNVPIVSGSANYSLINQWEDFPRGNLVSEGKGKNYGIEAFVEKRFYENLYFIVSGSVYKSQYQNGDASYRDSRFSGDFTSSFLAGKEWKKTTKTFGIHARLLYSGGLRQAPIDEFASSLLGTTVYDLTQGYRIQLPNYFRSDLRVSWRKDKPGYTRTISIDIQNLTNYQNVAFIYFDTFLQDTVSKYQLGIIPVIAYRVDF
jgi:hypothetical protein